MVRRTQVLEEEFLEVSNSDLVDGIKLTFKNDQFNISINISTNMETLGPPTIESQQVNLYSRSLSLQQRASCPVQLQKAQEQTRVISALRSTL